MVSRLLYALLGFIALIARAAALDFASSTWIWTDEVSGGEAPVGTRAFRKTFTPPLGKTPVQADVIMRVDDSFTLYVNGYAVGTGDDFQLAERFSCVALRPSLNVFAVTAANTGNPPTTDPNPAGLLAAIQITYSDGTTTTIVSDNSWRFSVTVPSGYEQLSFDDSSWKLAVPEGPDGIDPWGQTPTPSTPSPSPVLSLTNSNWIWTNELVNGVAPFGSRAFRRTYTPVKGQAATSATVMIVTDDLYTLYVNGVTIGSGTDYHIGKTYTVNLSPASNVVFAVNATNISGPAGLLVAIQINTAQCSFTFGQTDANWKSSTGVPAGFQLPGFDDSSWSAATVEGPYGMAPWGNVTAPPASSPVNA
ncbi:lectin [Mycena pura]|uniref:Lectin n=1 Tax=Mycena pura TaxID=153505 RepID=A0AAD6V5K1_9AGAR|nr:lectin [Mycena pura]